MYLSTCCQITVTCIQNGLHNGRSFILTRVFVIGILACMTHCTTADGIRRQCNHYRAPVCLSEPSFVPVLLQLCTCHVPDPIIKQNISLLKIAVHTFVTDICVHVLLSQSIIFPGKVYCYTCT